MLHSLMICSSCCCPSSKSLRWRFLIFIEHIVFVHRTLLLRQLSSAICSRGCRCCRRAWRCSSRSCLIFRPQDFASCLEITDLMCISKWLQMEIVSLPVLRCQFSSHWTFHCYTMNTYRAVCKFWDFGNLLVGVDSTSTVCVHPKKSRAYHSCLFSRILYE